MIPIDTSPTSAGTAPGPAELVAAALAACILENVERFGELLPFRYQAATVHLTAERRDTFRTRGRYLGFIVYPGEQPPRQVREATLAVMDSLRVAR